MFETFLDPIPVREGNVITIKKAEAPSNQNEPTLAIRWFGTSSYELRLGAVSVLTDPFVTYKDPPDVISVNRLYNHMESDPVRVGKTYGSIRPPTTIFIGHSHYDHMMDTVAALKLSEWNNVPVYGSPTTRHILAGYPKDSSSVRPDPCRVGNGEEQIGNWSENWCPSKLSPGWKDIEPDLLSYQSFEAMHAYHIAGITLWKDKLDEDLKEPPRITNDFQMGKVYIHIFELKAPQGVSSVSYKVAIVGAATEVLKDLPSDLQIFANNNKVDVLILCVPGWDNIDGHEYPKNLIDILRPRVILLTHYDNFFNEERDDNPERLVPSANFNEFLNKLQKDIDQIQKKHYSDKKYSDNVSILIPGVGTTLYLNKPPGGVINVSRLSR